MLAFAFVSAVSTALAAPSHLDSAQPVESYVSLQAGSVDTTPRWHLVSSDDRSLILEFELDALRSEELSIAGESWRGLTLAGGGILGGDGQPGLPSAGQLVAVPRGAVVRAKVLDCQWREISDLRLLPVQPGEASEFQIDNQVYGRSGWQSAAVSSGSIAGVSADLMQTAWGSATPQVLVGESAVMAGQSVVPVTVCALTYDPAGRRALALQRVRVELEFVGGASASLGAARPIPASFDQLLATKVLGYQADAARDVAGTGLLGTWLIFSRGSDEVQANLAPLMEWRRRQGYHVEYRNVDLISNGATAIKAEIQNVYDDPTIPPLEFVVIAGDATGSFGVATWNENRSGYNGEGDHYFVTLEGDDVLADAHIGRLSFSSPGSLEIIVDKILGYEQGPPLDNTDWLKRACLMGDPSASGITTIYVNQWLKGQLLANGWADVDTVWSGNFATQMVNSVNQGVSAFGYRGYLGMSGINNGYINGLTNYGRLPVAILPTCATGSFKSDTECRSEAWLRAPTGGAVAAVGTATIGTHTRYNNCYYHGMWDGLLNAGDSRVGPAHSLGKVELYTNYQVAEPNTVEIWSVWNNIMGDPATRMWTGVPSRLTISHPAQLSVGAQAVPVQVTAVGQPVEGALVCASNGDGLQVSARTDGSGQALLAVPALSAGNLDITVTGINVTPYIGGLVVGQEDVFCGLTDVTADDSAGNGDGIVNPGETLNLDLALTNHGSDDAFGVTGELTSESPWTTVGSGSLTFGDLGSGSQVWSGESAQVDVDAATPDGTVIRWRLIATNGADQWISVVEQTVQAAAFSAALTGWGGPGSTPDPGESGAMLVTLANGGSITGTGIQALLTTSSDWITIQQDHSSFGTIVPGGDGNNSLSPFSIAVSSDCFAGHLAEFALAISYGDGLTTVTEFVVPIGSASSDDPTGPDAYGYYAIDDTDVASGLAPVYDWFALDPDHSGPGQDLDLSDFGWEQDDTSVLDLPFDFQYYGEVFDAISVCSNGWVAMGTTPLVHYRNFNIPSAGSPGGMIAPFWDNLYQSGTRKVYHYYDEANHRYIVQWYNMYNTYANSVENFELILLDPAHYPTSTGDGMIIFQYDTVANTDSRDGYATVGIQNLDRTDGVAYTYWNSYAAGAATLTSGRAILFVPRGEAALPEASVQPGEIVAQVAPGDETVEYLHITNSGDADSQLSFLVTPVDPAILTVAKSAGDDSEPEVEDRSLDGSTLILSTDTYEDGTTVDLLVTVTCVSPDQEWLMVASLDVPEGVTVNGASDLPGSNGTLTWNGEIGDGAETSWGHLDGGGFLTPGASGSATLSLTFAQGLSEDLTFSWNLDGDNYGGPPHSVSGEIVLASIGPVVSVESPTFGDVVFIGNTIPVLFTASGGPETVDILLQRSEGGPWQTLVENLPAASGTWDWNVSGDSGPYAVIQVVDSADESAFATSGVFAVSNNVDWIQMPVSEGLLERDMTADLEVHLSSVGLAAGDHEAALLVETNAGAPIIIPVTLTVGDISATPDDLPTAVTLLGNYPNPFNPQTVISFTLPAQQDVQLAVYSARGRLVRRLLTGQYEAGVHRVVWDGQDATGRLAASGVYFYRLQTGNTNLTGKMVLAK